MYAGDLAQLCQMSIYSAQVVLPFEHVSESSRELVGPHLRGF